MASIGKALHVAALRAGTTAVFACNGDLRRRSVLEAADYLSPAELEAASMDRLRQLLAHAFTNVPYYEAIARKERLSPDDFQTRQDLSKLPLLSKRDIQADADALRAKAGPSRGVRLNHTGGSTGEPLHFYQDDNYRALNIANKHRTYEWCGYRPGDPVVYMWGAAIESAAHKSGLQIAFDRARNLIWLDTNNVSDITIGEWVPLIVRHAPSVIIGFTASLVRMARRMSEIGAAPPASLHGVQCNAEVLSEEERDLISRTLRCGVFDRYGCREVGLIAHECEAHQGLHVVPISNIVEIVDDSGAPVRDGQVGRVVVTNLSNYAMPFVRYAIEDMAAWHSRTETCSCGRQTARLTSIIGRVRDTVVGPSGKVLYGQFFNQCLWDAPVRRFQVVQETTQRLTIRLVPMPGKTLDDAKRRIESRILQHGDPALEIEFIECEVIEQGMSGKHRHIISEL